jgi:pimeloyl-ACP methyl ester carboxylesterase
VRRGVVALAVLLCLAIVATGCTFHPPKLTDPFASEGASTGVAWSSCTSQALKLNPSLPRDVSAQCGTVTVPQDWRTAKNGKASDGRTFDIAVMRLRSSKQTNRIGSILVNPGGPGASGITLAADLASSDTGRGVPTLMTRFDLVGFDPRGVEQSAPVKCISDSTLDQSFGYEPDPVSDAQFQGAVAISRTIASDCKAKLGEQLGLYSTEQTAHDMDAIRAALGEDKLNYLGFSYGTLLGAVYAELFPKNIRAMVLDGAVDPTLSPVDASENQAVGFERAFSNFTTWCNSHTSDCAIAPDARGAVTSALNSARTSPVRASGGRVATSGWVFTGVLAALYSEEAWSAMATAIANLRKGDARIILALADSYAQRDSSGHYDTLFDANTAINCTDSDKYPMLDTIRSLQSQWRAKYPMFGAPLALGMVGCSVWPAKHDPYPVGPATGAPTIIVVGTKGDPATPFESTAKLANMLGTGQVVAWDGQGHTAYPSTKCIRDAVENYFIDLTIPAKGLTCPPQ